MSGAIPLLLYTFMAWTGTTLPLLLYLFICSGDFMHACYQCCLLTDIVYCLISFQTLCSEFEDDSCSALCQAVTRHVQEAETAQDSNNGNWWKIHEACMLALGSAKSVVVRKLEAGEVVFDLTGFLQNVVITDMNSSG